MPGLSNALGDFLHRLDDFRMVGLAGIAQALREIVWPNAIQVDTRYREDRIQVVEHDGVFQQRAYEHPFVCIAVVRRLVGNPSIVIGAPIGPEGSLTKGTEVTCPYQLACVRLRRDVWTQYPHDAPIKITQDRRRADV